MDIRDIALQSSCPVIAVPRYSVLLPAENCGERILMASNGIFVDITRKWGRFVRKIGEIGYQVPYGEMTPHTSLTSLLPNHLLREFRQMARQHHDREIAASIVWNEVAKQYHLLPSTTLSAGADYIRYEIPPIEEGDHVVVDCHSHAHIPAFFSRTDDRDDRYSIKFSYVVGNCNKDKQTEVLRLCLKGIFDNIFSRECL